MAVIILGFLILVAIFCLIKTFLILIKGITNPTNLDPFKGIQFAFITIVAVWLSDLILKHPFESIRSVIFSILCIGLIYLIKALHEIGHFLTAKLVGLDIKEFVVGQGIVLYETTQNHIKYQFKLFPTSGYVKIDPNQLENEPTYKKILFYSGGVILNLFTGILALIAQFIFFTKEQTIKIINNSAIALEKLFTALEINSFKDLIINPNLDGREGLYLFRFFVTDFNSLLFIFFLLSLTIAISNLLPIPPLDGGKIMWELIEKPLRKMKVSKKILSGILITITVFGLLLLKGPMVINFTINYAQMINMTVFELFLWSALVATFFINIMVFIQNKKKEI